MSLPHEFLKQLLHKPSQVAIFIFGGGLPFALDNKVAQAVGDIARQRIIAYV
jgi:hypothetical protein